MTEIDTCPKANGSVELIYRSDIELTHFMFCGSFNTKPCTLPVWRASLERHFDDETQLLHQGESGVQRWSVTCIS